MKRRRLLLIVVGLLALVLVAWFAWPRPREVDLVQIQLAPATRTLAVNGTIRPRLSVAVQSPVGGTLIELGYDVGDRVAAGTLLARVDDAPQRAAIAEAEAAVGAQSATLAQARRDLARYNAIGEFVTRQRREEARLAVERGTLELRRLQASLSQAREVRGRLELRAPFAGVILERPVDPGQTIGVETIIYRLADLAVPEVTAEVDELYTTELKPGGAALIALPGREAPLRAAITFLEPRVDPTTGAREVRLRVLDPLDQAPSGLTVTVNLVVERRETAISIPRSAILQPDGGAKVRVVDGDGRVSERGIRFLDWPAGEVIVTQGLAPGMRILADPQAAEPGAQVRPRG